MIERIIFIFLLLGLAIQVNSQGCNGNLGDNIFQAGDFGSGTDNILQEDQGIAPGYIYRTTPPPQDGEYVITNSLAQWANRFDWPPIESDNSSDPNGYMMVVNASNTPGKFYEQQVDGLCENTLYVFSADVMNIHPLGRNYIKPNVSFAIDGITEFSTGDVPENGQWNSYGFTFTTGPGVTSVILSLVNNAPGGIGNDLILDNIKFQACGPEALILPETVANICEDGDPITLEATVIGDQYDDVNLQWQQSTDEGLTWQDIAEANDLTYQHTQLDAGFYYYRYLLAGATANLQNEKCRVNSNVKVINVIPKFYNVVDTLCEGLVYMLGTREIGASGSYTESLKNNIGCDSIVNLELTILEDLGMEALFDIIDPSCSDIADGSVMLSEIINGYSPISVYVNDEAINPLLALENLDAGEVDYGFVDNYGCEMDTTILLTNPPLFTLNLGEDQVVALGDTVEIVINSSQPVMTYTWSSDNIGCTIDCEILRFVPLESFSLGLMATSMNGCISEDVINVTVEKIRGVYFPNAMTPNSDGANDYFTIYANTDLVLEIEELGIYDRWGSMVFTKKNFAPNDPQMGWDGKFNNKDLNSGTYVYVVDIRFIDNQVVQYSGVVNIVR